ncbi:methylosome protein WDR77-like isoform X1 [Dermacentor variabilis]|uniref:methylosome protein WDR77-like isoform X1 n=2 Tax=Dermacentor variabilis TaxID=34621 RepID=UPI003F5B7DB5
MASVPCATFHKNIDDIKRCKDGSLVLACNNLFGTKWEGSVRLYKKKEDIPSLEECVALVNTDSTVADIVPLNPGRFMLGLDSGGVEMLQLAQEEPRLLDTVFYRRDHDGGITSLALSPDRRWLASTGWDFAIKLWDMTSMECSRTYVAAHSDAVWKVVFSTDPNVFLSCSKDGKVQSWDMRLSKPATVLGEGSCGPTTLDWQPLSASSYAVGLLSGALAMRDIRQPAQDVLHVESSDRPLHRILFCPDMPSLLAVCADNPIVQVLDVSKMEDNITYRSEEHSDFVRGLCWTGEHVLLSAAWDGRVVQHSVGPAPESGDAPSSASGQ